MHTHFDSLHINSLRETAWNICCMYNKCVEFYRRFTKDKNNNNKKESSSKDHKLIFNQTLPTSNWKSSMTFKTYFFHLNIPGICTSEVSSFVLFRFLDVLKGCREKILSLGLPHCLTIKYFINTLIIKSWITVSAISLFYCLHTSDLSSIFEFLFRTVMYASRIVVSASCMPSLIGSSRFMFTRQGSRNARQLTAEK